MVNKTANRTIGRSQEKVGYPVNNLVNQTFYLDFFVNDDGTETILYWFPSGVLRTSAMTDIIPAGDMQYYTEIDLDGWEFGNISYAHYRGDVDLTNVDTTGISDFTEMFYDFQGNITGLDSLDVSSATVVDRMFKEAVIPAVDTSGWDLSHVQSLSTSDMFEDLETTSLNTSGWVLPGNDNGNAMYIFYGVHAPGDYEGNVTIDVSNWTMNYDINLFHLFSYMHNITLVGLDTWDTSHVTSIGMFEESDFDILNLTGWNLTNLNYGYEMEMGYNTTANKVITDGWTVPQEPRCPARPGFTIQELTMNNWDLSDVSSLCEFAYNSTFRKTEGFDSWDTSGVIDMSRCFSGCQFESYSNTDPSEAMTGTQVFASVLTQLSYWNIASVRDFSNMFDNIAVDSATNYDFTPLNAWRSYLPSNAQYNQMLIQTQTADRNKIIYPDWNGFWNLNGTFVPHNGDVSAQIHFQGFVNSTSELPSSGNEGDAYTVDDQYYYVWDTANSDWAEITIDD